MTLARFTEEKEFNVRTGELETLKREFVTTDQSSLLEIEDYSTPICESMMMTKTFGFFTYRDVWDADTISAYEQMGRRGEEYLSRRIELPHSFEAQPAVIERSGDGSELYEFLKHGQPFRERGPHEVRVLPNGVTEEVFPRLDGGTITRVRRGVHRPELKPITLFAQDKPFG